MTFFVLHCVANMQIDTHFKKLKDKNSKRETPVKEHMGTRELYIIIMVSFVQPRHLGHLNP